MNLETIKEIGEELLEAGSLKNGLARALSVLYRQKSVVRCFAMLYDSAAEKLQPFAAEGLKFGEFRRLENLAAKNPLTDVLISGNSLVIESGKYFPSFLSDEKNFDNFTVVVPIKLHRRNLGVLAAEFEREATANPAEFQSFLEVIAVMMAQAVRVEREISKERERLAEENSHLRQELKQNNDFGNLIGNSGLMRRVYDQVSQISRSNTTILLRGESGTGKETIANVIHYNSLRSKKAFIKVNCAALPETLIESELFGYEKGAFTGANGTKKGSFEIAEGGTLFLDEIGDLPPQTQIKLLRVLQEREFERLGGTQTLKVNVRLIVATNKNLEKAVAEGIFREDLFYRLNTFTIFLPPLRDRKSDILLLAEHFLEKYERVHNKRIRRISTPAIDMLTAYHFPGNVRELENVIERAVLICDSNVIHGHHLPPTLQTAEVSDTVPEVSLEQTVEAFERDLITDALKTTRGNAAKAAQMLNTTERIIGYKIKKYAINPRRFRD